MYGKHKKIYTFSIYQILLLLLILPPVLVVAGSTSGELTGESTVIMPEDDTPEVIKITLPTDDALDFILDPQGLSQVEAGESVKVSELNPGRVFSNLDVPAVMLNEGSVPIMMTVELAAISQAGGGENTDKANFVNIDGSHDEDDIDKIKQTVFDGEALNVLLYVVPSDSGINMAHCDYSPAEFGFIITEEPITLTFFFPQAEYDFIETEKGIIPKLIDGTGNGTQIKIGGYINSNANWVNFTDKHIGTAHSTISITATFSWYVVDDQEVEEISADDQISHKYNAKFLRGHGGKQDVTSVKLDEDALETLIPYPADSKKVYMPVENKRHE